MVAAFQKEPLDSGHWLQNSDIPINWTSFPLPINFSPLTESWPYGGSLASAALLKTRNTVATMARKVEMVRIFY